METPKKILMVGCGDLAQGCIPTWVGHAVTAIARNPKVLPSWVDFWQGALTSPTLNTRLGGEIWDAIVITLTPDSFSYEAYWQTYWLNTQYILHTLHPAAKPLILFVSSTSVYAQTDGSWVDENSTTQPTNPNAQCLLATEQLLVASQLPLRILRCSGIYGPGRDHLVQQVRQHKGGDEAYTNRIHRDDVCAVINFLLRRHFDGYTDPHMLIGSDHTPIRSNELRNWLAQQMGLSLPLTPSAGLRGGNKRCASDLLRHLGYQFLYPDYVSGYLGMLKNAPNLM